MTIKMKTNGEKGGESQSEENRVQVFVQQMLITRIFAATYTGRFYVEPLKNYRDVIKIYEEEKDLMRDLEIVKKRINNFYKGAVWAAITAGTNDSETEASSGCCVWVKLENVAFGSYWFMIEHVSFSDFGELVLKVKVVRKFDPEVKATQSNLESSMNWDEIKIGLLNSLQGLGASSLKGLQELLTWHNMKESSKFIMALLMTLSTALLYGLQYLGDYSIRFFKEFNNFIKVMTPIFLAIIDMVSKTIGGFYLLIVMMWRGQGPVPQFPNLQAPPPRKFKPVYQQRAYYQ